MLKQEFSYSATIAKDLGYRKRPQQGYQRSIMAVVPGKIEAGLRAQQQSKILFGDKSTNLTGSGLSLKGSDK